ncbi:acetyl-CoA hydrolase/transferase family protein [Endozoicomonas arenosclerae]|uniref:acetyl-CoA hydrolase/transferase family protein n=1 Tax=Endozoicomonas arenosclerae TaxID=1633495 RepID=UPI000781F903|nr:acetyl-CoA hydrolase/transferase C-terminal domain-containing protein [Endozoicomonas arenosclerae]
MSYKEEYRKKLRSAADAVQIIPKQSTMVIGLGMSEPPALLSAVEDRVKNKEFDKLRLYYMHPATPLQNTLLKMEYLETVELYPFYGTHKEWELLKEGLKEGVKLVNYIPANFHQIPHIMTHDLMLDTCVVTVSPMTGGGYFSTGTSSDYTIVAARNAKRLIIEVNENMPQVFGNTYIHISEVDAIVENTVELPQEPPHKEPSAIDEKIASHIIGHCKDGMTIQIGAGNVPNAVCKKLSQFNDMGIHSELLSPSMVQLIKSGNVNNRLKSIDVGKSVFTLSAGNTEMFEFIHNNPGIEGHPASYVNDPCVIGRNDRAFSLNAFVEIDLFGQVNAEFIAGHQYSTVGGQLDFIEGAQRSKEGVSILSATSTAGGGKFSRIVKSISGPATDTRNSIQYVATEYGITSLRGKSTSERARALIDLAHPDFRPELEEYARSQHYI